MSEPVWVPGDWATVKVGDRVRLVFGDDTHEFTVMVRDPGKAIYCRFDRHNKSEGWSLFVEVPPTPELPTTPGYYLDKSGYYWELDEEGWALNGKMRPDFSPVDYAPFTRLEPRHETAKAMRDRIRNTATGDWLADYAGALDAIAAEFGVEVTD